MCGEHCVKMDPKLRSEGSSPHVRGTRNVAADLHLTDGIIPACAGNTDQLIWCLSYFRDHPRMCGEHRKRFVAATDSEGSSPHVRGTHGFGFGGGDLIGIIPACAGNTAFTRHSCRIERDHPRMCGEHSTSKSPPLVVSGSSPHVRGTLNVQESATCRVGIIPACAGNTRGRSLGRHRTRDHPRMCGEHCYCALR